MKLQKLFLLFYLILFFTFFISTEDAGSQILKKADFTLVPKIASYDLKMIDKIENEEDKINIFKCFKKTDLKYLFFAIYPETIYGQASLRIENTIWTYYPLTDQMIKTSYKSAFLGTGLSYVDVMYNELVNYYNVKILDSNYIYQEKNWNSYLNNKKEKPVCFKLLLTAKKGAEGYPKAILYIDKENFLTIKREYYSLSDEKMKEIYFYDFKFGKNNNITDFSIEVIDYLGTVYLTLAYFNNIKILNSLPDSYFSLNFIKTYKP